MVFEIYKYFILITFSLNCQIDLKTGRRRKVGDNLNVSDSRKLERRTQCPIRTKR